MFDLRKNSNKLLSIVIVIVLFGLGFTIGKKYDESKFQQKVQHFNSSTQKPKSGSEIDFSLFWSVWDNLDQKFVSKEKLDPNVMYYGAIKGMVSALGDPYTFFLTPDENKQSKDDLDGLFEGIGAQLGLKEGRIVIVAPLKASPAEKIGIKSGDFIIKVDGSPTLDWPLQKAVSKIRGKKGTTVKLTIMRDGNEKTFSIVRDSIKIPSVELEHKNDIAVLKLNRFGDDTTAEWDKHIAIISEEWKSKKIKGMVLDVRDNPGGFLQGAIYIASEFIPRGQIVVKQEYKDKRKGETFTATRDGLLQDIPLVVLINNGSASASEIVAGAMRDHKRAKLVGEKSFGKGSIQEALDMGGGAGLHVTIAKWILPNGDWINGKGIYPSIVVKNNEVDDQNTPEKSQDKQLDKAIETVLQ